MRTIVLACAALAFSASLARAAEIAPPDPNAPKVSVVPIITTNTTVTGQKIDVPQNPNVVVSIVTFPPGAALPTHEHRYPHYVYVLEGTLTVTNVETGKSFETKQGEFLVEMNNTWHFGKNNGGVPVKLLVIDQLPAGTKSNMELPPAK